VKDSWEEALSCAVRCSRCNRGLAPSEERILSVYDHRAVCMACKKEEEARPDYGEVSRAAIGQCMAETEVMWGDPKGYCFHHFYPYKCG